MSNLPPTLSSDVVDREVFRDVVGRFASGVTIVSTRAGGRDYGTTASAFSSLSLEPPMILVCLNQSSDTGNAILSSRSFAVSVLRDDQLDLARCFAVKSAAKFDGLTVERGTTGAALFPDALAHVECRVINTARGGTHTVFLAEALAAVGRDGRPLTYFRGSFGQLEGFVPADRAAPLEGRSALEALQTRCAVELAVVDLALGAFTEADLQELGAIATSARLAAESDPPDTAAVTAARGAFHDRFVALLDNSRMQSLHRGLTSDATWPEAFGSNVAPGYLTELVDACAVKDADRARRVILDHFSTLRATVDTVAANPRP